MTPQNPIQADELQEKKTDYPGEWNAMSVDDKTRWLATHVMRWHKPFVSFYWYSGSKVVYQLNEWRPLECWDHAMEVLKQFRWFGVSRGLAGMFCVQIRLYKEDSSDFKETKVYDYDGKDAICGAIFCACQNLP